MKNNKLLTKLINTKAGDIILKTLVAPVILIGCLAMVAVMWLEDKR